MVEGVGFIASMSSELAEMNAPVFSEAQRRAQARKQKILAMGNTRILVAKGEAVRIHSRCSCPILIVTLKLYLLICAVTV